jgi:hypothetical protein
MGISAKDGFLGWLGYWINDKEIIFSYDNWVIDDWRMCKKKEEKRRRRGIKNGFHLGLAIDPLLCYK